MSGIPESFRTRFVDLLACAVAAPSWQRSTFEDGEPTVWWAGDATAFLARELAGRVRATSRNFELGGHPALEHEARYERTAGLKTRDGQDILPDIPIGARAADFYLKWAPVARVSWPTTTTPQVPSAPPDAASLVSSSAPLVADLVTAIGAPAFAALRPAVSRSLAGRLPERWVCVTRGRPRVHLDASEPGRPRRALCGWTFVDTATDVSLVTCKACLAVLQRGRPRTENPDVQLIAALAPTAGPPPKLTPQVWGASCRGGEHRRCGVCAICA